jgi:phage baseplate assembly protein W
MAGLGPRLPLSRDSANGFGLVETFQAMAKQNLKMLLLTVPGERVMIPLYGVGMRRYLFEQATQETYAQIDQRIREQVSTYMPYISIQEVQFGKTDLDSNVLGVSIKFSIPRIGATEILQFTI